MCPYQTMKIMQSRTCQHLVIDSVMGTDFLYQISLIASSIFQYGPSKVSMTLKEN